MHGRPVHQDLGKASPSHPNRWRILGVLVLALLVTSIDHTIINVALPQMVGDLGADAAELQWVVAAYTVVFAGLLLTAGSLGDRFGRRPALAAGLATFLAGSTDGDLYLLDATGRVLGHATLSHRGVPSSPALDGDRVYVGSGDGLHALGLAR